MPRTIISESEEKKEAKSQLGAFCFSNCLPGLFDSHFLSWRCQTSNNARNCFVRRSCRHYRVEHRFGSDQRRSSFFFLFILFGLTNGNGRRRLFFQKLSYVYAPFMFYLLLVRWRPEVERVQILATQRRKSFFFLSHTRWCEGKINGSHSCFVTPIRVGIKEKKGVLVSLTFFYFDSLIAIVVTQNLVTNFIVSPFRWKISKEERKWLPLNNTPRK